MAAAAGEQTHNADAAEWAQEEHIDAAAAATAADAATAQRKEKAKKWTCAECGKAHKERSAVLEKGKYGYVCLEVLWADGWREDASARRSARGRPARERPLRQLRVCAGGGVSK